MTIEQCRVAYQASRIDLLSHLRWERDPHRSPCPCTVVRTLRREWVRRMHMARLALIAAERETYRRAA